MKKVVFIVLAVVLVAAIGGGIFYYKGLKNSSAKAAQGELQTAVAEKGNLVATISTSGNVILSEQQKLSFGAGGTVKEVKVVNGSEVKKGDVLAVLDTVPLERSLSQALDNLEAAEIALQKTKNPYKETDIISSESSVLGARNSVTSAQRSLDDYMKLYTETDLRLAEADVRNAGLNLQSALMDQKLNVRVQGNSVGKSYEQELQASEITMQRARTAYRDLLWRVYKVQELIPDTDYHLHLNPMKMGFIAEDAFDRNVEDAYWAWINADINYQKLVLEKTKNEQTLQNNVDKIRDAIARAEQNLANIKKWPEAREIETRKAQIESAQLALRKAEINLAEIKAGPDPQDVILKENQVEQSKISVETARENLEKAKLPAPFDGVIFNLTGESNQTVSAGTVVMQIVNPSKVRIDITVDEVDVSRVRQGQEAEITFDALQGMVLNGKVSNVAYVATRTSGITNFLTSVELDVARGPQERPARQAVQGAAGSGGAGPSAQGQGAGRAAQGKTGSATPGKTGPSASPNKTGAGQPQTGLPPGTGAGASAEGAPARQRPVLRDGMTALVTINTEKREGVLIVPNRAITSQVRNRIVKVKVGDQVEERMVRTGLTDGSRTEILSGVEEGETVIIPQQQVRTSPAKPGAGTGFGKIGF